MPESTSLLEAYTARTTVSEVRERCQDGGVVTTLLITALRHGIIDAAITCKLSEEIPLKPIPLVASREEELVESAGSKYSQCPVLAKLREAVSKYSKIAIVGLPCHLRALRLMEMAHLTRYSRVISLKIGLFCTNNFPYSKFIEALDKLLGIRPEDVSKIIVRGSRFMVLSKDGRKLEVKISAIERYASKACSNCPDFSGWFSDISVGSTGSKVGWSSVLIRTERGRELFTLAVKEGLLEARSMSEKALNRIARVELKKKKRAFPKGS